MRTGNDGKEVRNIYVFYADVFLVQNLLMDVIALLAAKLFLRKRAKTWRLFLAAVSGSLFGLCLLLVLKEYLLYCVFTHFFLNTAMVWLAFGKMGKREFLKTWSVTYIAVLLCGGGIEWMGGRGIASLLGVLLVIGIAAFLLEGQKSFGNHLFEVQLLKDGKRMLLAAYWDSGNQLRDIYTGKPVCILSGRKFTEFFGENAKVRYIPFTSLGEKQGVIPVADADELVISQGEHTIRVTQAAIGAAGDGLLEKKEYDLILHASLHE